MVNRIPSGKTVNLWTLHDSACVKTFKNDKPVSYTSGKEVGEALSSLPNDYRDGHLLYRALSSMSDSELGTYDTIVLISPLRVSDFEMELDKTKEQLKKLAEHKGTRLVLIAISEEVPAELAAWFEATKISLIHQLP